MKKLQLNDFKKQELTHEEMDTLKGGFTFCEWYVGITNGNPDPDVMQYMMWLDQTLGLPRN